MAVLMQHMQHMWYRLCISMACQWGGSLASPAQAARRTQQQLQEQLGSLQGQSAAEAAAAVASAVAALEQQQQQQQQHFQQQVQQQMMSLPALRRPPTQGETINDAGSDTDVGWLMGPMGPGGLDAMPSDRALAAAAEGGRAQAWAEALQERLAAQQVERDCRWHLQRSHTLGMQPSEHASLYHHCCHGPFHCHG